MIPKPCILDFGVCGVRAASGSVPAGRSRTLDLLYSSGATNSETEDYWEWPESRLTRYVGRGATPDEVRRDLVRSFEGYFRGTTRSAQTAGAAVSGLGQVGR